MSAVARKLVKIDIVSDIICPWCFVGKRRLERAMEAVPELEYQVRWHPFLLDPTLKEEGKSKLQAYEEKFGKSQFARMEQRLHELGLKEGINFAKDGIVAATYRGHQLIRWAESRGKQDAVVEGLFKAYFEQGKSPAAEETLITVADEAGLPKEDVLKMLQSGSEADAVVHEIREAQKRGIHGVPHFSINDHEWEVNGAQESEAFVGIFREILAKPSVAPKTLSGQACTDDSCPI